MPLKRILVTSFEPFALSPTNASSHAAQGAIERLKELEAMVTSITLPVAYGASWDAREID